MSIVDAGILLGLFVCAILMRSLERRIIALERRITAVEVHTGLWGEDARAILKETAQ